MAHGNSNHFTCTREGTCQLVYLPVVLTCQPSIDNSTANLNSTVDFQSKFTHLADCASVFSERRKAGVASRAPAAISAALRPVTTSCDVCARDAELEQTYQSNDKLSLSLSLSL